MSVNPPSQLANQLTDLRDEVHVWSFNPSSISEADLFDRCFDWLSLEEKSAREKLVNPALRHAYLAAHALCRSTLSYYAKVAPVRWRFERAEHGKPFIAEPSEFRNLCFNLTHTHDLAACAVTDGREVGIDAEAIRPALDTSGIERRFFSAKDREALVPLHGQARIVHFFQTWVLKEAYLKACGIGLLREPDTFTIPPCDAAGPSHFDGWQLTLHQPSLAHVAAVAVRLSDRPIRVLWHEEKSFSHG